MNFTAGTTDITAESPIGAAIVYANLKMGNIGCPEPEHISTDGNVHTFRLTHAYWGAIRSERTFILIEECEQPKRPFTNRWTGTECKLPPVFENAQLKGRVL